MSGRRVGRHTLLMLLLVTFALMGCASGGDDGSPAGSGALAIGTVITVPSLDGSWHFAPTVITNGCGTSIFPLADETIVRLTQASTALVLEVFSPCGTLVSEGRGTVDSSGVTTLIYDQKITVSETCSLKLHQVLTGTVNSSRDRVSGGQTLTISALGDCGPSLPCQISGTFLAQKCPPADCTFRSCGST